MEDGGLYGQGNESMVLWVVECRGIYKTPFAELGKIWMSGIMTYGNEHVGPASYEPP